MELVLDHERDVTDSQRLEFGALLGTCFELYRENPLLTRRAWSTTRRGRGIGGSLMRQATAAASASGARFVLSSTLDAHLKEAFLRTGFVPAQRGQFVRAGVGDSTWNPHWLYLPTTPGDVPLREHVDPGEF
jgi:predicted GNAT family N-acyltransferase